MGYWKWLASSIRSQIKFPVTGKILGLSVFMCWNILGLIISLISLFYREQISLFWVGIWLAIWPLLFFIATYVIYSADHSH